MERGIIQRGNITWHTSQHCVRTGASQLLLPPPAALLSELLTSDPALHPYKILFVVFFSVSPGLCSICCLSGTLWKRLTFWGLTSLFHSQKRETKCLNLNVLKFCRINKLLHGYCNEKKKICSISVRHKKSPIYCIICASVASNTLKAWNQSAWGHHVTKKQGISFAILEGNWSIQGTYQDGIKIYWENCRTHRSMTLMKFTLKAPKLEAFLI